MRADKAADVVIRFSDGTTAHPETTWFSEPIGAGFSVYDAPPRQELAKKHIVAVDAVAANGDVVKELTVSRQR